MCRETENNSSKKKNNSCGPEYGVLSCSKMFEKNYTVEYFIAVALNYSKKFKYHEIFDDFPREDDGIRYEHKYLRSFSIGLYEYVLDAIEQEEQENPLYSHKNLRGFVSTTVRIFFDEYIRQITNPRTVVVNNDLLIDLMNALQIRTLSKKSIELIVSKVKNACADKLLEMIREIPGYRKVWFKKKKKENVVYFEMNYTEPDLIESYQIAVNSPDFIQSGKPVFKETNNPNDHKIFESLEIIDEIYKKAYESFTHLEKCVFKHWRKLVPVEEIRNNCWEKNVTINTVYNAIERMRGKIFVALKTEL